MELPQELEDIILSYQSQLEHYNKFKYCLEQMKFMFKHIPYPEFYPRYASFNTIIVIHRYYGSKEVMKEIIWDHEKKKGIIKYKINNLESNQLI